MLASKKVPGTFRIAGSAKYMPDAVADAIVRTQGVSTWPSVVTPIAPTAPRSPSSRARSARACDLSAPDTLAGPPLT